MAKVKITTITPVHIGTGNVLREGFDYIKGSSDEEMYAYFLDLKKIAEELGHGNIKTGSSVLTSLIENNKLAQALEKYDKAAISNRCINMRCGVCTLPKECRELIRDGRGMPYIPGSSIKGAIRTALLSYLAEGISKNISEAEVKRIEKELIGDIENDFFRFIHVGDAYFKRSDCVIFNSMILNERVQNPFIMEKAGANENKCSLVEAIEFDCYSTCDIKIANGSFKISGLHIKNEKVKELLRQEDYSSLFQIINNHTKNLINKEIDWWKKRKERERSGDYSAKYVESLEYYKEEYIKHLDSNSCILRLGYGSGYRFITGDWIRNSDCFQDLAIPGDWKKKYNQFEFPKSRRVSDYLDEDDELILDSLGFVKLTLI